MGQWWADTALPGEVEGVFWIEGGPQVRGTLSPGKVDGAVVTRGIARRPESVRIEQGPGYIEMRRSGDPKDAVLDSRPIPLLGTLDDGRNVTILDASLADTAVTGAQTFNGPRQARPRADGEPTVAPTEAAASNNDTDTSDWNVARWVGAAKDLRATAAANRQRTSGPQLRRLSECDSASSHRRCLSQSGRAPNPRMERRARSP